MKNPALGILLIGAGALVGGALKPNPPVNPPELEVVLVQIPTDGDDESLKPGESRR